jgi:histone acetyltransferase (RNA polymerase elongator complex component)
MRHANVALFVPNNGCPHACSFCNQKSITGKAVQPTPADVVSAAETALAHLGSAAKIRRDRILWRQFHRTGAKLYDFAFGSGGSFY